MSRRKQGKPQQRKTIDALDPEADHDTLTCGACQTVFPLADIVKFIQHKVNRCNKENVGPFEEPNGFDDEETREQDVTTVINNRRPSISAPISRRSPDKHLPPSPRRRPSIDSLLDLPLGDETNCTKYDTKNEEDSAEEDVLFHEKKIYHRQIDRRVKVVEVGVNTTATEPFKFICSSCKSLFSSAWNLVQHAQKVHSFKIYLEPSLPEKTDDHEKKEKLVSIPSAPKVKSDKDARTPTRSPTPRKSSSPALPTGVHEAFAHPHAPFMFPMHDRQPLSPALGPPGPFHRPPGEFRMDFRMELDPFQRIPVPGMPGIMHRPPFEHPGLPPSYPYTFKRHPPVPEPPSTGSSQGGSAEDFYSQRLRQLAHAGPPSSPSDSPSPGQKSGPGIRPQQSNPSAFSPSTSQPPAPPSSNDSSEALSLRSPQLLPPKQKACEFCGKCFRFQSNLIVHRRSHTGDKPFRCTLCPHACTQASKLKRHMKIHRKSGSNSAFNTSMDQSNRSPSSTPDSTRMSRLEDSFEYDESDMERQVEDDDEAAALEEEMALAEISRAQGEDSNSALQTSVYDDNEEKSSMDVNEEDMIEEDGCEEDPEFDDECDSPGTNQNETLRKSSLLSEVMENSGLKDISEYNEAFRQALKDQNLQGESKNMDKCRNMHAEIAENGIKEEQGHNVDRSRPDSDPLCDSSSEPSLKKMKLEPIEIIPRENNPFQRPESLYSNPIWFPPTAMPPELFMRHTIHGDGHMMPHPHPLHHPNGSGLINHNSAFKINSTRKHGTNNYGQLNAPPTTAPSTPPVPVKRRNDTCEFCGKIFKNCSNLTVHRRSHTGEKPYKCQLCSYACAQSSKLTRHMRTHGRLGKDVYRCKFCGMPFSVPSTLEKHMRKCVGNQQGGMMDHEKSSSGMSPTGLSPVGMSPVGSGHSPVGSLPTSSGGAFSPPSSGVPSPTSGTLASSGASQQGKPTMMDLDNGMSPATSVKSGHSPQSSSGTFALPSSGIPSPTSGTLPLPSSGALP